VGPRAGLDVCEKSRPTTGIRSPDRPARNQSLYRLSYPGPLLILCTCHMYEYMCCPVSTDSVSAVYRGPNKNWKIK
jgi:hypothetical protein